MSTLKIVLIIFSVMTALVALKIYFITNTPPQAAVVTALPQALSSSELAEFHVQAKAFKEKKSKLVSEIMAMSQNAMKIENHITQFSKSLSTDELKFLKHEMQDAGLNREVRSLSTELVMRNQTSESLAILVSFLENKDYDTKDDFENKIRAEAIEGIYTYHDKDQAITTLEKLEAQEKNNYLAQLYRRSVVSLRFNKPF